MESIARRNLMKGGAVLAVVAAVPVTATAAQAEDAELVRLWGEAVAAYRRWAEAHFDDGPTYDAKHAIEELIASTPAEGLRGLTVKLALWRCYPDWRQDGPEHNTVDSAYEALVRLTGWDPAVEAEAILI
jgi:hypothetical protein